MKSNHQEDFSFYEKLLVLGEKEVGKSSLIDILTLKEQNSSNSDPDNSKVWPYYESKWKINWDDKTVHNLQVIELNSLTIDYIPQWSYMCQCAIVLFEKTKYVTFLKAKKICEELRAETASVNLTIILISNKSDKDIKSEVEEDEIMEILNERSTQSIGFSSGSSTLSSLPRTYVTNNISYWEISCLNNDNISKLKKMILLAYNTDTNSWLKDNKDKDKEKWKDKDTNWSSVDRKMFEKYEIMPKHYMSTALNWGDGYNVYKIILLGDSTVGKTSFLHRFFLNEFTNHFTSTIGIEASSKYINIRNKIFKIQLWDTAGQERFRSIPKKYYEKADGIVLLYDTTNEESFKNIAKWMKDINESAGESVVLYLVGNKIDLSYERKSNYEKGLKIAKSNGMKYAEVSCKWDLNVSDVIYSVIHDMYMINKDNIDERVVKPFRDVKIRRCCA